MATLSVTVSGGAASGILVKGGGTFGSKILIAAAANGATGFLAESTSIGGDYSTMTAAGLPYNANWCEIEQRLARTTAISAVLGGAGPVAGRFLSKFAAEDGLAASSKWGSGWASPGPVAWRNGAPFYDPANFEMGVAPHLNPVQRAGVELHEAGVHFDQFVNQPWKVWYAQSKLPGASVAQYGLESEAYRAQASFLGETYQPWMPFQSHNVLNAAGRDLLYGGGALGAGGAALYYGGNSGQH